MTETKILSPNEWPASAEPDGLVYELAVSHALRPKLRVVTDEDGTRRTTEELDYKHETAPMDWEFVDKPRELPELDDTIRGTYAEVSAEATRRNDMMFKPYPLVFYPTLARLAAA